MAFQHTIRAFEALAPGVLSERDTASIKMGVPFPAAPSLRIDPLTGRRIYLQGEIQDVRLTIYDGRRRMVSQGRLCLAGAVSETVNRAVLL